MSYTIKHLCEKFKISRSALLYYDQIGLFSASYRSPSNYRRYSDEDIRRLEQICIYREVGLQLEEIKKLLDAREITANEVLEQRLHELNDEINKLRNQQRVIIDLLKNKQLLKQLRFIDKETLIEFLRLAGFNDAIMSGLHAILEHLSPQGHEEFLKSLGINDKEIAEIRKYSKEFYDKRINNKEDVNGVRI